MTLAILRMLTRNQSRSGGNVGGSFGAFKGVLLAAMCFCAAASRATELATGLTEAEIKHAGSVVGFGALHRPWTAHAMPSSSLGLDLGVEAAFAFRRDLLAQGNQNAVLPRVIPMPRLWFSWDFPFDLAFSGSFCPGFLFDGVTAYGAGLQWFFHEIPEFNTSLSVVANYSHANAFSDLRTNAFSLDVQASRDLTVWQPYIGAGLVTQNTTAAARVLAAGVKAGPFTQVRPHFFLGARIDLMTKLSVQLDVVGTNVALGALFANTF